MSTVPGLVLEEREREREREREELLVCLLRELDRDRISVRNSQME